MHFVILKEDGRPARTAREFQFIRPGGSFPYGEDAIALLVTVFRGSEGESWVRAELMDGERYAEANTHPGDVTAAARLLAKVFHQFSDLPLVVPPESRITLGATAQHAEVYPAGRHPLFE